jgi:UDP-GlcNAc:undecaprenyl-phosphate GlcNAc-1-phosphate transferase
VSDSVHIICLGVVAFIATFMLVPVAKRLSKRLGAIDYPSTRRVNTYPVPRLGGLALFGGLLIVMILEAIGEHFFAWRGFFGVGSLPNINYFGVIGGVAFMVLVGAIDDVINLHPGTKFAGQLIAATIVTLSGVLLSGIASPFGNGFIGFGYFAYPLTILYLVAFANIINLIDGLDGLAAGTVFIVSLGLFFVAFFKGCFEAMILAIALVGICLAFLCFNRHPASLYMGDSGALMLGTLLGIISLIGTMRSPTVIALIVPIVFAGIPVLDTLFSIIRRIRRRQPVTLFDLDHFHHILLKKGFNQRQVVYIIYVWTAFLTAGGVLISNAHGIMVYVLFVFLALISTLLMWKLGLFSAVLLHHYNPRETPPKQNPHPDAEV